MSIQKFWGRVKTQIKAKGITQKFAAQECGIPVQTFYGWISKGVWPTLFDVIHIARYLGVSLDYLVYGKEIETGAQLKKVNCSIKNIEQQLAEINKQAVTGVKR